MAHVAVKNSANEKRDRWRHVDVRGNFNDFFLSCKFRHILTNPIVIGPVVYIIRHLLDFSSPKIFNPKWQFSCDHDDLALFSWPGILANTKALACVPLWTFTSRWRRPYLSSSSSSWSTSSLEGFGSNKPEINSKLNVKDPRLRSKRPTTRKYCAILYFKRSEHKSEFPVTHSAFGGVYWECDIAP